MGSYTADSHHIRRIVDAEDFVRNEGNPNDRAIGHKFYEIPYCCLTPRPTDGENLLVIFCVCVSALHLGFASLRMEPVFMILSDSAGVAAAMAAKQDLTVQDVPIASLRWRLIEAEQRLGLTDLAEMP